MSIFNPILAFAAKLYRRAILTSENRLQQSFIRKPIDLEQVTLQVTMLQESLLL